MNNYTTIEKNGEIYVLRPRIRATTYNNANFMNTGLALAGTLKRGQSLKAWEDDRRKVKSLSDAQIWCLKYGRRAKCPSKH